MIRRHATSGPVARCLAVALAIAVSVSSAPAASAAAGAPSGLAMRWAAEGMFLGDMGETRKSVTRTSGSLRYSRGLWQGTMGYTDVLGVFDGNAVVSQVAVMELRLEGSSSTASDAGGTFSGIVTLTTRPAGSLEEAAAPDQAREEGGLRSVYDVGGVWSANLSGSTAAGVLTFNSVGARRGGTGPIRGLDWFVSPVSEVTTSGARSGHPFAIRIEGPLPQGGLTTSPGASPDTSATPDARRPGQGFFDYVRRGVAGVPETLPPPVAPELQRQAQLLVASKPLGAMALPANALAIDVGVSGALLDAKNVAFRLTDLLPRSTSTTNVVGTSQEWGFAMARGELATSPAGGPGRARRRVGRHPVILESSVPWLASELASRSVPGAREFAEDMRGLPPKLDSTLASRLLLYLFALSSVDAPTQAARATGVLKPTASTAQGIRLSTLDLISPEAGPVLAAADSLRAPLAATGIAAFTREKSLDASAPTGAAVEFVQAAPYAAYRRSGDGAVFWLAAPGDFALRDASLVGWGWQSSGTAVVDPRQVGVWRAFVDTTRPRSAGR